MANREGLHFGQLAGRLFADYAIRAICEGGSFKARQIDGTTGGVKVFKFHGMSFPDDIVRIFDEQEDIKALAAQQMGVPIDPSSPVDAVLFACVVWWSASPTTSCSM